MEYHVPSWAVVKTWRDENLLSLYVVYTCFDGFRRNKEIVPAERERERARPPKRGLESKKRGSLMKFNIRGYSTAVSRDSFPQGCVAARVSPPRPLKNKNLLFCESEVSEHLISLFSPVPPLLLLSLLTRIIPVEDFSLPLSHPVSREQLPSSSFRLRTKRNPAPGCFFSLPPFPRYSREKRKERKKGRKERNTQ